MRCEAGSKLERATSPHRGVVIQRLERDGKKHTIFDDEDLLSAREEEKEGKGGELEQQPRGGGAGERARSGWWSTAGARRRVGRMACGGATVSPLARVCEHLRLHPERCAAVECVRRRTRAADLCTARGSVAHQANMLRGHRQLWAVPAARARDARTGRGRHATAGVVQVRGGRHSERARSRGCARRAWTFRCVADDLRHFSLDLGRSAWVWP